MTDRCWDRLRTAGAELAANAFSPAAVRRIAAEVARDFELPQTREAEAVSVFLGGLCDALDKKEPRALELPEAAE